MCDSTTSSEADLLNWTKCEWNVDLKTFGMCV